MEQECKQKIGILGGGPAGCCAAYFLKDSCDVTLFEHSKILRTLLPTGGGRCNLAHAEYDFKELATNYPRGEKFLYSVFSRFATADTISLFKDLGIDTYTQDDNRIFPISNSSSNVREAMLNAITDIKIKKEKGLRIEQSNKKIKLITDMNSYTLDKLIIATGGHTEYDIIQRLGIHIIDPKPALVGLQTKEKLSTLAGIVIKNASLNGYTDDLLFTHKGISGPLIYKISSIKARDAIPYNLTINLLNEEFDLQDLLNKNPHKNIGNLLAELLPKKLIIYILTKLKINFEQKCHSINGEQRDLILENIHYFNITVTGVNKDSEVVTAGGVDLKTIDSKTMESKIINGLYFIGEVLDIDGFCGGFNLQNCWSTAYVATYAIKNSLI